MVLRSRHIQDYDTQDLQQPEEILNIVATSDLHGTLPEIPECDLLLIAGDICPFDMSHEVHAQADWLKWRFAPWLKSVPAKHIVGIAGNHDFALQRYGPRLGNSLPWTYLQDSSIVIDGVKIHGTPWVPTFHDWAFMKEDPALVDHWDMIPSNTDILMVHGPPRDILDIEGRNTTRVGSGSLRTHLTYREWSKLQLVVFGHIHHSYGSERVDGVLYTNVAHMNEVYDPVNPPRQLLYTDLGVEVINIFDSRAKV
jgi:Icc-related predicted phosphoesterase